MRRVLIVSPRFPPINAPDHQRVRASLGFYRDFGWDPLVLTVSPDAQEGYRDDDLAATLPPDVPIVQAGALPASLTRPLGLGDLAIRAFASLYRTGARIIASQRIDLVFFSTTAFAAMPLGRLWNWRYGVPYVLDMQDPWVSDYTPARAQSLKQRLAAGLHGRLEPFTMRRVDGIIAVSPHYIDTLCRRYPWIDRSACVTIPFGFVEHDFRAARRAPLPDFVRARSSGELRGVYVGAGGEGMRTAARILFRGVRRLAERGELPGLLLQFIGTDYAPPGRERQTIKPEADAEGVGGIVEESPRRVPYFTALRLLLDSDFLVVLGSSDGQYNPSKIATWLAAKRPLIAILHQDSPAVALLRAAGVRTLVTFGDEPDIGSCSDAAAAVLRDLLTHVRHEPSIEWAAVEPYGARELTRRQCGAFDAALQAPALARRTVPCSE